MFVWSISSSIQILHKEHSENIYAIAIRHVCMWIQNTPHMMSFIFDYYIYCFAKHSYHLHYFYYYTYAWNWNRFLFIFDSSRAQLIQLVFCALSLRHENIHYKTQLFGSSLLSLARDRERERKNKWGRGEIEKIWYTHRTMPAPGHLENPSVFYPFINFCCLCA